MEFAVTWDDYGVNMAKLRQGARRGAPSMITTLTSQRLYCVGVKP